MSFSAFHYEHGTFSLAKSIPIPRLYILTACIRVSNSLSFLQTVCIRCAFPRYVIGIIAITNSNRDSAGSSLSGFLPFLDFFSLLLVRLSSFPCYFR